MDNMEQIFLLQHAIKWYIRAATQDVGTGPLNSWLNCAFRHFRFLTHPKI